MALGGWLLCVVAGSDRPPLLSRHAEPARVVPAQTVAVRRVASSTVPHRAREPATDAARSGYTPCVRCLRNLVTGG